ncbi:ATP-dependent dethiobiotin synthetase BioD, partial [Acidithiobacillus sp.]|uniref:ATP-dependent dethiobiotin synthetase BioD n=1 Tax=Acidithiobacillus sp. TaxID=1872118 RepID=UPI003D02E7BD
GVFVTGTGVGKTWVAAALARLLMQRGLLVRPRKPVESGCATGENGLLPQDAAALCEAARGSESPERPAAHGASEAVQSNAKREVHE